MGETGMMIAMLIGYAFVFLGIGIFFQGWRQMHRARQQDQLVTDGCIALCGILNIQVYV